MIKVYPTTMYACMFEKYDQVEISCAGILVEFTPQIFPTNHLHTITLPVMNFQIALN